MYPAEQLHSRKTRRSILREEHPPDAPTGDRSYLPDPGRRAPGMRRRMTGHQGSSRTRRASGDPAGSGEIPLDTGTMPLSGTDNGC